MATGLLGYWPGETTTPTASKAQREEAAISKRQSIAHESNTALDIPSNWPFHTIEQRRQFEEDIFNTPEISVAAPQKWPCVPSSSGVPRFEPLPPFPTNVEDNEWQKFQPPKELFDVPYGTPLEIESIIVASVEKLQQQLAEEQSVRENAELERLREAYRTEEDISLVGVTTHTEGSESLKSRTPLPRTSAVAVTKNIPVKENPRLSDASINTNSSGDSGYVSGQADISPSKGKLAGLFRFHSSLRLSRDKVETPKRASLNSISLSPPMKECVSCLDDFVSKDLVPLTCHSYCKPCFQTLIGNALSCEDHWPPKCCLTEISPEIILPHLSPKDRNRYKQVLEERSVPAGERIYCSKTSCALWIPPKNIDKGISCAACPSCRQKTCISCRGVYHATGECPRDANLQATLQVASDEGWRRCYSCNAMVEHNQGCMHMTCRCKAQFCYICGSRWRTCSCTDLDLQRVLQASSGRRLAAQAREIEEESRRRADLAAAEAAEAEAAEFREVLRMIEQFEIEEAERLAQEEEELRLAAIASRQRHEEDRVLSINKKYFDLTNDLNFLHAIQKVSMTERHEEQRKELRRQDKMRTAMLARHAMEIHLAETEANAKISDSQFRFDQDYSTRLIKEREIEDKYVAQLTEYWEGRPGGTEEITEGRDTLRKAHEESYRRWDEVKRQTQQQIITNAKSEVAKIRSVHEIERAVTAGKIDGEEATMNAGRKADAIWFDKVMAVRAEMLEGMEVQEYALEEDLS